MHRQSERFGQRHHDSAPRTTVELGDNQAGHVHHLLKHLHLLNRVLTGRRVQHQQHRVRRRCVLLAQDPDHFRQFFHQCRLVVQPPSRIDQQHVGARRFGLGQRVKRQARRVSILPARDHWSAGALTPDLQLLHRRRAERIARDQHGALARVVILLRQLADRRRLAGAVHPDHQHNMRLARRVEHQRFRHRLQNCGDFLSQGLFDFLVSDFLAKPRAAERGDHPSRGIDAEIG